MDFDFRAEDTVWSPQVGAQTMAVLCPADLVFFGGARGGGKTDCALGRQIIGALTHEHNWNGLFLRKNFKHFADLRRRIDGLIRSGLPAIRVGGDNQTNTLRFDNGAKVLFTAIERPDQLEFFQGQSLTEISVEEACQFGFVSEMIDKLKACLRSAAGVKCTMFLTGNPGGAGHSAIKARFISPAPRGGVPLKDGDDTAIFIPSNVEDNRILCENDPKYVERLRSIRDPQLRRAWLEGDWDAVVGGFFDDVWEPRKHIVRVPRVPRHWPRICGMDWGSARPFSVGWFAVSGGEELSPGFSLPRGSLVQYDEWYGCVKGEPNTGLRLTSEQVAHGILEREKQRGEGDLLFDRIADTSIFDQTDGPSIGEKFADAGVVWRKADKRRLPGWERLRGDLRGVETSEGNFTPMLYFTDRCRYQIELLPTMQRDENNWEDIDCLVAGTMITMPDGSFLPIESVSAGDLVATPLGPRPVLRSYCSGESLTSKILFNDGRVLEGTPTHKIFVDGDGLLPLGVIDTESSITDHKGVKLWSHLQASFSEELSSVASGEGSILSVTPKPLRDTVCQLLSCIGQYGQRQMDQSQMDCMSTMLTGTSPTTRLKIWNSFLRLIMLDCITKSALLPVTLPATHLSTLLGENLQRVSGSYARMLEECSKILPRENLRALIVAALQEHDIQRGIFARSARKGTTSQTHVLSAELNTLESASLQRTRGSRAGISVAGCFESKDRKQVFSLVVEQAGLYYANGVLVSNTDAVDHGVDCLRYVIMSRQGSGISVEEFKQQAEARAREIHDTVQDWEEIEGPPENPYLEYE